MKRHTAINDTIILVAFFVSGIFAFAALAADDPAARVERGLKAMDGWQLAEAQAIADELKRDDVESQAALYFFGELAFYQGDYPTALDYANGSGDFVPQNGYSYNYKPLLANVYEVTKNFSSKQSAHFEVRYRDDKDAILVDAALETLEAARENLGQDLGFRPAERIVVEIYPELDNLARATGLTLENLHTSGVIAICKFNRLMITSPRVSPYGYSWRDTLNHEYVHLVIMQMSRNTVPVWLHEGIAKYLEERWRLPPGGELEATSESLLARALREDKLVTIEQISPSMAYLPSQEHTALAFAEVLTMVQWMAQLRGGDGIRQLLVTLPKNGGDLDATLRQIYGFDVAGLQDGWKRYMKQRHLKELDYTLKDYEILFGDDGDSDDKMIQQMEQRRGRKFMTLGKLLKDRGKLKAASMEFDKAQQAVGKYNILLQNLIAETYLELEQFQQAAEALKPVIALAPNYLPSRLRLGRALFGLADFNGALQELTFAFGLNPFDPRIHSLLAATYDKLDQPDLAKQARTHLEALGASAR
jgi:tetratricopeptide (TPR) repeat protein